MADVAKTVDVLLAEVATVVEGQSVIEDQKVEENEGKDSAQSASEKTLSKTLLMLVSSRVAKKDPRDLIDQKELQDLKELISLKTLIALKASIVLKNSPDLKDPRDLIDQKELISLKDSDAPKDLLGQREESGKTVFHPKKIFSEAKASLNEVLKQKNLLNQEAESQERSKRSHHLQKTALKNVVAQNFQEKTGDQAKSVFD